MSWAKEEWKNGLPQIALNNIFNLEEKLLRLENEAKQKQFNCEVLKASFDKQVSCNQLARFFLNESSETIFK